jgi:hypothetical protein
MVIDNPSDPNSRDRVGLLWRAYMGRHFTENVGHAEWPDRCGGRRRPTGASHKASGLVAQSRAVTKTLGISPEIRSGPGPVHNDVVDVAGLLFGRRRLVSCLAPGRAD